VTAWVKTLSPRFTVIEKRMERTITGLGSTCWRIGIDGVTYGAHEGRLIATFVTDVARGLLQEDWSPARTTYFTGGSSEFGGCPTGRDPNFEQTREEMLEETGSQRRRRAMFEAKNSAMDDFLRVNLETELSDGEWHLFSVVVRNATSSFYSDGQLMETLPNPTHQKTICPGRLTVPVFHQTLTDCLEGSLYVGDDTHEGQLADVRYFPRELTLSEIQDIIFFGAPLDDLINAGGSSSTAETQDVQEQRLDELQGVLTESLEEKQQELLKAFKTLRNDLVSNQSSADEPTDVNTTRRALQISPATESDSEDLLQLVDQCFDDPSYHDFMYSDCQW